MTDEITHAPTLSGLRSIVHGFSHELRTPADREQFARRLGVADVPHVRLRQVHAATVIHATGPVPDGTCGDALVADRPGVALVIATADCVPVLLADESAGVIGAVHAGWRGMRARVILRAVEAMTALGARPERLAAAIGPAVQGTCYEVGDDVRREFDAAFADASPLFNGRYLDLIRAAQAELDAAGIAPTSVSASARCTHCELSLASHRRQGPMRGNNHAVIARRPESA